MFDKKPAKFSPAIDRAGRIQDLLRQFKAASNAGKEILLTKTRGKMQVKLGIIEKTAWGYLQSMEDAGYIKLDTDQDRIVWIGDEME